MLGKVVAALVFALLTLVILFMFAALTAGVRLPLHTWSELSARLIAGSVPFITLGFAIGYMTSPNAAIAVINLIYLPLSFASGLFVPVSQLPHFVQKIAPFLPTYHYAQLAWSAIGAVSESLSVAVLWLAAYTVVFTVLALRMYWREERLNFG
jgi:ABC-2 type transport system permease protein